MFHLLQPPHLLTSFPCPLLISLVPVYHFAQSMAPSRHSGWACSMWLAWFNNTGFCANGEKKICKAWNYRQWGLTAFCLCAFPDLCPSEMFLWGIVWFLDPTVSVFITGLHELLCCLVKLCVCALVHVSAFSLIPVYIMFKQVVLFYYIY